MNDTELIKALTTIKDPRERCNMMGSDITSVLDEAIQRITDYTEAQADSRRLVHDLDVLWNGLEGAAQQASLCDIVAQIRHDMKARKAGLLTGIIVRALKKTIDHLKTEFNKIQPDLRDARRHIAAIQFIIAHDVAISSDEGFGDGDSIWTIKVPCGNRNDRDCRHFKGCDLMALIEEAQRAFPS